MSPTTAERIAQATCTTRDRSVKYVWRNPVLTKHYNEDNDSGEQVELEFSHDPKRKQYTASVRLIWWQPTTATGFSVTVFTIFDHVNFPAGQFHKAPVARYGDKSFAEFQHETLANLDLTDDSLVARLLNKAFTF